MQGSVSHSQAARKLEHLVAKQKTLKGQLKDFFISRNPKPSSASCSLAGRNFQFLGSHALPNDICSHADFISLSLPYYFRGKRGVIKRRRQQLTLKILSSRPSALRRHECPHIFLTREAKWPELGHTTVIIELVSFGKIKPALFKILKI